MATILFRPEPGGVLIPGSRLRECTLATGLLQDVLALGAAKLTSFLRQRPRRPQVQLDRAAVRPPNDQLQTQLGRFTMVLHTTIPLPRAVPTGLAIHP